MVWQSGGGGGFTPNLLAAFAGITTVPAGSNGTAPLVASIVKAGSAYTPVVGQSTITINLPGWYSITVDTLGNTAGEAGVVYHLTEGGLMDFSDGNPPEDFTTGSAAQTTSLQSTGMLLFDANHKTFQMKIDNPGLVDAQFGTFYIASYLGPA